MSYEINIVRGKDKGKLTYKNGDVSVSEDCWWDAAVKVDAGTYTGYATKMASKNRKAIWLGPKVPVNNGSRTSGDIFIHKGLNADWSDGCIVAAGSEIEKIYDDITPKNKPNVTIIIKDEGAAEKTSSVSQFPCYVADWFK